MLGLDLEIDGPAAEIAAHMALDGLGAGPAVVHVRHHAENVADELENRRLARPAPADDAVEAVAELEPRSVEKAALHLDAEDAMVRVMAAILALARRRNTHGRLVHRLLPPPKTPMRPFTMPHVAALVFAICSIVHTESIPRILIRPALLHGNPPRFR